MLWTLNLFIICVMEMLLLGSSTDCRALDVPEDWINRSKLFFDHC